jgi:hypothetical protein
MRPVLARHVAASVGLFASAAVVVAASGGVAATDLGPRIVPVAHQASAAPATKDCARRILVLSAFPAELGPLLAKTVPEGGRPVAVGGHTFYLGKLHGHRVVAALTGIGLVNARHTTRLALRHFRCGGRSLITAIVFSGVAGGDFIGDVNVPLRWTEDGKRFIHVSRAMVRVARKVVGRGHFTLLQTNPAGDPLCITKKPDALKTVTVTHKPEVEIGGKGESSDPFGGHAFPCIPGAGDVFGCRPCGSQIATPVNPTKLLQELAPFVNPSFFAAAAAEKTPPGHYVTQDMETAAVATVAHHAHIPFLGFRGVSDGGGDPLHLPGFPSEFFVYRQLSADNAAAIAGAFIRAWKPGRTD